MRLFFLLSIFIAAVGCTPDGTPTTVHIEPAATAANPLAMPSTQATVNNRRHAFRAGERPVQAIDRVLIISIDGLRPDLLLRAYMPRVRGLCATGSFTFWAETTPEAYTLPCHVTMLTGAPSESHSVTWNEYIEDSYPAVPTLFELAKNAGLPTALVSGKMKFIALLKPGTVDHHYLPPEEPVSDVHVALEAVRVLRAHRPRVMFVHFPGVDTAGHDHGWGSAQQLAAIEQADAAVGLLLTTLRELKLTGSTLILLTADHGGAGQDHYAKDPRSHFIPWIASGPGLHQDFDLTRQPTLRIGIEDTFATACLFLGLDPGPACRGQAVLEVLSVGPNESAEGSKAQVR